MKPSIEELHCTKFAGHRGIEITAKHIRRRFYWPGMIKNVTTFVKSCDVCNCSKHNRRKPQGMLQPLEIPMIPGTHYSMDFKTDLPLSGESKFDTLLVIVDKFSKRVKLIPTWSRASSELIAELVFREVVSQKGLPIAIISDRDPKFTSNFWRSLWELTGTSLVMSTSRHQNTDGQSENAIRLVEEVLRGRLNYEQDNWVSELSSLEFALNNSVSQPLGMTPFYCETGRNPIVPIDLSGSKIVNISTNKETDKSKKSAAREFFNVFSAHLCKKCNFTQLKSGCCVFIKYIKDGKIVPVVLIEVMVGMCCN